jgi:hypothetical protein
LAKLNLQTSVGLSENALFTSSVNFTPRSGAEFGLGDAFDVDVTQLEWMPTDDQRHSVFVGKVDSVIGIEYKTRKASQRFGITPSLLHRYTAGTAVGIKARSKLFNEHIIVAGALTNGSFGTEQFHFAEEIDSNPFKTLSGRFAINVPVWGTLEVGGSGQIGVQDHVPGDGDKMWFLGVDLEYENGPFALRGQYLQGEAPGDDGAMAYALDLRDGGYLETSVFLTSMLGVLVRAEFRDASVSLAKERLYFTKSWRGTAGVRVAFNPNMILKAEYLYNGEYGEVPSIPNNLFTTSLVLAF